MIDKFFVNAIGLDEQHIFNTWYWIKSQILAIENVELCHDEKSKILFLQIPYFWDQNNIEKIKNQILAADKIIISDLLNYDNNYNFIWKEVISKINHPNITCITNNRLLYLDLPQQVNVIVNDFLMNRTKLYYFEQNKLAKLMISHNSGFWLYEPGFYTLNELNKDKEIKKIFLSLTRNLQNFRRKIVNYLIERHNENGYIGCYQLDRLLDTNYTKGYCPVPHQYYNDTLAAIYVESTSLYRNIFHATEKTFEPLLKGIFVLPYSNTNFVRNLQNYYGFKIPNFIDYTYDSVYEEKLDVDPTNTRVLAYFDSIDKLCNLKLNDAIECYKENFEVIEHNRNVIINFPYDTLIDKLWQQ